MIYVVGGGRVQCDIESLFDAIINARYVVGLDPIR